jgi:hypothetical protein
MNRILAWSSWFALGASALTTVVALFAFWGVNAESVGAHDAGLALLLAFTSGFALVGSLYAAPVLTLIGLGSLFLHRDAGLRFLAAAVIISIPLVVLAWTG